MREKDELIKGMLHALEESKNFESLQHFAAKNSRITAWSAMAGGDTMDIGGVCSEEELEAIRKERTELKSKFQLTLLLKTF